jgi:hemerythrin-like domain-containing protein
MTTVPDIRMYLAIHQCLRLGARAMAHAVADDPVDGTRAAALRRYWKGYAGEVLAHHTIEDEIFFPALADRVPVAAPLTDRTDDDHAHLDEMMDDLTAAFDRLAGGDATAMPLVRELLADLDAHMTQHLDFEDADVLPLFVRHFTGEEYEALDRAATKTVKPGPQAAFTVPFVAHFADPADLAFMLERSPAIVRIILRLTRKRHARLVAAALGSHATQPELVGSVR